jgi:hypothetical protein
MDGFPRKYADEIAVRYKSISTVAFPFSQRHDGGVGSKTRDAIREKSHRNPRFSIVRQEGFLCMDLWYQEHFDEMLQVRHAVAQGQGSQAFWILERGTTGQPDALLTPSGARLFPQCTDATDKTPPTIQQYDGRILIAGSGDSPFIEC